MDFDYQSGAIHRLMNALTSAMDATIVVAPALFNRVSIGKLLSQLTKGSYASDTLHPYMRLRALDHPHRNSVVEHNAS
jgi:hypothetical protein